MRSSGSIRSKRFTCKASSLPNLFGIKLWGLCLLVAVIFLALFVVMAAGFGYDLSLLPFDYTTGYNGVLGLCIAGAVAAFVAYRIAKPVFPIFIGICLTVCVMNIVGNVLMSQSRLAITAVQGRDFLELVEFRRIRVTEFPVLEALYRRLGGKTIVARTSALNTVGIPPVRLVVLSGATRFVEGKGLEEDTPIITLAILRAKEAYLETLRLETLPIKADDVDLYIPHGFEHPAFCILTSPKALYLLPQDTLFCRAMTPYGVVRTDR